MISITSLISIIAYLDLNWTTCYVIIIFVALCCYINMLIYIAYYYHVIQITLYSLHSSCYYVMLTNQLYSCKFEFFARKYLDYWDNRSILFVILCEYVNINIYIYLISNGGIFIGSIIARKNYDDIENHGDFGMLLIGRNTRKSRRKMKRFLLPLSVRNKLFARRKLKFLERRCNILAVSSS